MIITILLTALGLLAVAFTVVLIRAASQRSELRPTLESIGLGAVTNFFDTLGIGSFATTTAWIKFRKLVPDSFIPATLNVGHALPTVVQSAIFLVLLGVHVDPILLVSCIVAAVVGALVGAPIVLRAPVRVVQGVVGLALLIAAVLYAMSNLNLMPIGGVATALAPPFLYIAIGAHFILGILMAFGIGLYAPSLILLSLMGLDPRLAFPIMASACAFLMPTTGFRFITAKRIDLKVIVGIAIGGMPAVLAAAFIVKEMPIVALRWGVVVVVLYAATLLLRSAMRPMAQQEPAIKLAQ
ncbi:MAG: sulfite exporter TauE/SafE family protein [Gammaproteobacteria bacterium]|nr:sulfite exporter TauE/SafE family protein [Gammaproteobacteria bacterium]